MVKYDLHVLVNSLASYSTAIRSAWARLRCRRRLVSKGLSVILPLHHRKHFVDRCLCSDAYDFYATRGAPVNRALSDRIRLRSPCDGVSVPPQDLRWGMI
jgi:hypothetical protein